MTAAATTPAIAIEGLRKVYGRTVAVHDLSLEVPPGSVFGFLGPNGAGKSTTIKVLTGLVRPTAGRAAILGIPVADVAARRLVGFLPETFRFHDWMTGEALLAFHARLAGLDGPTARQRIPEVLSLVGLAGRGAERIRGYSKGMTQRVGLAQALIHRPPVVLLDEPTSALDPVGRREVRDIVRRLRSEGVTVFLNSHLLTEIEFVCDAVAIVDHGRVVRSGSIDEVVGAATELHITVDRVDQPLRDLLARQARILDVRGSEVVLALTDPELAPRLAQAIVAAGYQLHALVPAQPTLEDVFVALVSGNER